MMQAVMKTVDISGRTNPINGMTVNALINLDMSVKELQLQVCDGFKIFHCCLAKELARRKHYLLSVNLCMCVCMRGCSVWHLMQLNLHAQHSRG